jgi:hypothetical protein
MSEIKYSIDTGTPPKLQITVDGLFGSNIAALEKLQGVFDSCTFNHAAGTFTAGINAGKGCAQKAVSFLRALVTEGIISDDGKRLAVLDLEKTVRQIPQPDPYAAARAHR